MANGVLSPASVPINKPKTDWNRLAGNIEGTAQKVGRCLGIFLTLSAAPVALAAHYGRTYLPTNFETSCNSFYFFRRLTIMSSALGIIGIILWYFNRLTVTPEGLLTQRKEVEGKIENIPLSILRKEYPHPAIISNQELNLWLRYFLQTQTHETFRESQKNFHKIELESATLKHYMANAARLPASINKPKMDWNHLVGDIEETIQKTGRCLGKFLTFCAVPVALATHYGKTYLPLNDETSFLLTIISSALGVIGIIFWYFNRLTVTPQELLAQRKEVEKKIEEIPLSVIRKEYSHPAVISNQELNAWLRYFLQTQTYETFSKSQKNFHAIDLEYATLKQFEMRYDEYLYSTYGNHSNRKPKKRSQEPQPVLPIQHHSNSLDVLEIPNEVVVKVPLREASADISIPDFEVDMDLPREYLQKKLRDRWTAMTLKEILSTDRQCFVDSIKNGSPPLFLPREWTQQAIKETTHISIAEMMRDYLPLFEAGVLTNKDGNFQERLRVEMKQINTFQQLTEIYGSAIFDFNLVDPNSSKIQDMIVIFVSNHAESYLNGTVKEPALITKYMGEGLRQIIQTKKEVIAYERKSLELQIQLIRAKVEPMSFIILDPIKQKLSEKEIIEVQNNARQRCEQHLVSNLSQFKERIWQYHS